MRLKSIPRLTDFVLTRTLNERIARECVASTVVIALIAEFDSRRLYLPAGHPSMFSYCVHELHLSEDSAYKRIRVARAARRFPEIFTGLASGRLTLSAVVLLAPHLTEASADALLAESTHKTNAEVEALIAERFPRPDVPTCIEALAPPTVLASGSDQLAVRPVAVDVNPAPPTIDNQSQLAVRPVESPAQLTIRPVATPEPRPHVAPLSPERFALQLTMSQATHDKLRYAQALLSHRVSPGDIAEVIDRALDALIPALEKEKFAATTRPQSQPRSTHSERHVPAAVKREVWLRDRGQCTFVGESGRRCAARELLEFDHIDEVARGGEATSERMPLRCRAHNQFTAECTFGAEFMSRKREEARRATRDRRIIRAREDQAMERSSAAACSPPGTA